MSGLYVNTNVQSITAQNQLNRNMAGLSDVLTRLSTGLRINSGKDDPAGLIASELMKADMTATTKAISNVQRANSMVAIADAALGQISALLNDIKGLINEAASTGTMTYEQILANQLQVDASLDSIDRIAKTTNYLGKNILDGSLDFTTRGVDRQAINQLNIYQANFGTRDEFDVGINIYADAARAQLFYDKAGVSQDTVFEVVGNDGSSLVQIAGGQSVVEIADAINLVSDSTGVRAIVGRDATAGQIFLTSAGLDNDINLTALMAGANAGNYTIKFSAGNTDYTTYTITDPSNGNPGIIDFQLKMQPNVAPYAERLDESYNGMFTYSISGVGPQGASSVQPNIVVQTNNGHQIRHIEYVQSAGPNPSIPGGVAATFDKVTGKLQILYDASGNLTEDMFAKAINAIDGFEYKGMFIPDPTSTTTPPALKQIPNIAMSAITLDNAGAVSDSGYYIQHTHPSADGLIIVFETDTGIADEPTADYDAATNTLTITVDDDENTTYQHILDLLNRHEDAEAWTGDPSSIPPGSFQFVNQWGETHTGLNVGVSDQVDGTSTHLGNVDGTVRRGYTEIVLDNSSTPVPTSIFLETTHVDWNGLSLAIDVTSLAGDPIATTGNGAAKLNFSYDHALLLEGVTFSFFNDPGDPGGTPPVPPGETTFTAATGVLRINMALHTGSNDDAGYTTFINDQILAHKTGIETFTGVPWGTDTPILDSTTPVAPPATSLKAAVDSDIDPPRSTRVEVPKGVQSVEFDEFTGTITVNGMPDTTYDEVLAALKNSRAWVTENSDTTVPPAVNFTVPANTLGLAWTDAKGSSIIIPSTPIPHSTATATPLSLNPVLATPASITLQEWLASQGTGTKAAYDMRANNAINITAAIPGTKFENTDVAYLKAKEGITNFTEMFKVGHQELYITDRYQYDNPEDRIPPVTAIQFQSRPSGTDPVDERVENGVLIIGVAPTATLQDVEAKLNNYGFNLTTPAGLTSTTAINYSVNAGSLAGTSLHLSNVHLGYHDTPTRSAATITLNNGEVQMRFVADEIGTQFNDVTIVFEQDTQNFKPGDVSAVYDEARKILHIRGQLEGTDAATYGALKAAVEAASPFRVDITNTSDNKAFPLSGKLHGGLSSAGSGTTGLKSNSANNNAFIKTGQFAGDIGTNAQTLYIMVAEDAVANDVVDAFRNAKGSAAQIASNFIVSNSIDNNGNGAIFSSAFDQGVHVRQFAGALTGGNSGLQTDVTAKELIDLINNDALLSKLFVAEVARGQVGNGYLTLFDEAAYYGSPIDDNALQFLGPKDSPDVLFVIDGPNSELGISFVNNYGSGCITDDRPVASLNATNANAAFSVQALLGGSDYDDMVVRMIRLDNNHTAADSYAVYKDGPSNAMAYVSIYNDAATDGTPEEQGKFIVYANQGGEKYNNVDIVAVLDIHQTEPATARFDETTGRLIITVNSGETTLSEAMAAINKEGTFQAEFDFSFNTDPTDGSKSNGPGLATFERLLNTTGTAEAVIGNTGNTGGRKGGVLEVYVGGKDEEITAQRVIDTINSSPTTKSLFSANPIGGVGAGSGIIDFRADNIQRVLGSDGQWRNEVNMVTGILGSDENATSYMVIHLATDANGNSITTANDLVKFFDLLTPEQTRGISVSVVRPAGVDNLDRKWSYDSCGNIIEEQLCDNLYGHGLLQPTYLIDDCYNIEYFPIEFFSYGQDIRPGNAYGSVIAQNGKDASLDIRAKSTGPDFNGVGFKYVKLSDPMAEMYAEYDGYNKMITVFIHEGTTAGQVKQIIETSEQTRNLFEATLPGNGSGIVSLQDDYLLMRGGLHDVGYRGGAAMLGAADADANRLTLESIGEGSRQFVSLRWMAGGDFRVTDINGNTTDTASGSDMIATINGMKASADGRSLTLESAMLKLGIIMDERVTAGDYINFTITGGGAVVQMGTDVVSNQQMRFGIQSVNTANLGGASGFLYQLRTGGAADLLTSDASRRLADRIVNEAIMSVAQTRGRLGAIQRSTLEPQINALQDSLVALSSAEAQISNADFAEESSKLTRAQILVQAGTRTLSIANQFPQYAASLLGG